MNTKIIKLDINKKLYETISAKQGDTESRFLLFHIFDSSLPFDLREKSVRVYGIKPDDTKVFNDLVINDAEKGYCTLELTNQILAIAGLVKLELVIYNGNKKLSSIPFVLNVIPSLNSDDAVVSTNEFTALMNGFAALSEYDIYKSNAKQVPGIKEEVSNLSSQLDNITNKTKIILTPSMFGAKGDDITDDYDALWKMFNFRDNVEIFFPKDKIYRVSRGIGIERQNITVYGNNSTIKFTDNSKVLQEIYDGTVKSTYKSTLLTFGGYDNFQFYNLNLDGNADNVFFIHNGEKYYGYQQDLGIDGIPSRYICTYGFHGTGSNNVILENCNIKHIGSPINLGGVWGSNDIKRNIVVKNIEIEDCFRDAIVVHDCEDFLIENPKIINGQRKGIQCYRNAHKGKIINPEIINDETTIRMWYPSWDKNNADAELSGIAIQNPGYIDVCTNIEIVNPNVDVYKTALNIRNYSENISVHGGILKSRAKVCIDHTGVIDLKIKDITLVGNTVLGNNYVGTTRNLEKKSSTNVYDNVNFIGDLGIFYDVPDECPLEQINVLATNITFECTNKIVSTAQSKSIVNMTTNSLPGQTKNGVNIINPYEIKNVKTVYPTKFLYKGGTDKQFIKFATFSIGELNKCVAVKGSVTKVSGSSVIGFDFKLMVRSHYEDLSKGIISDLVLSNNINATGVGIGCVKTYDSALNIERIDVYLISSVSGNYVIDTEVYDYDNSYEYEVIATNDTWQTDVAPDIEKINE